MKRIIIINILLVFFTTLTISAQNQIVPIVEMKIKGLMGGVQNGKWLAPQQVAPKMKAETEFVLVGFKGAEEGGVTLGKKAETEDVCQDFQRMEFELETSQGVAFGSVAKWNFVPRAPQEIGLNNETYKKIVADFLKTKGIAKTVVKITQAFRVDLEGDGQEEVLLSATFYKDGLSSSANKGDYSVVLLRKIVGGKAQSFMLAGDFVTKPIDFGAPNEHEISAIADLNGDGKMEVVLYGQYYEGAFARAFEIKANKPVEIKEFSIGCGV